MRLKDKILRIHEQISSLLFENKKFCLVGYFKTLRSTLKVLNRRT